MHGAHGRRNAAMLWRLKFLWRGQDYCAAQPAELAITGKTGVTAAVIGAGWSMADNRQGAVRQGIGGQVNS